MCVCVWMCADVCLYMCGCVHCVDVCVCVFILSTRSHMYTRSPVRMSMKLVHRLKPSTSFNHFPPGIKLGFYCFTQQARSPLIHFSSHKAGFVSPPGIPSREHGVGKSMKTDQGCLPVIPHSQCQN